MLAVKTKLESTFFSIFYNSTEIIDTLSLFNYWFKQYYSCKIHHVIYKTIN